MEQEYLPGDTPQQRLQDLMKEYKITQAELASKIGVTESSISRFLNGTKNKLTIEQIISIARIFNVSSDSAGFATFEQRMQSDKDGIPMERINLDDLLPGEDPMQRSDLIADPYASEPEKIMEEAENRKELYEGLRRIRERERVYLLYRFGFEDDIEHPLVGTALHFHLSESRARSTEALALDNLWLELPWWY